MSLPHSSAVPMSIASHRSRSSPILTYNRVRSGRLLPRASICSLLATARVGVKTKVSQKRADVGRTSILTPIPTLERRRLRGRRRRDGRGGPPGDLLQARGPLPVLFVELFGLLGIADHPGG